MAHPRRTPTYVFYGRVVRLNDYTLTLSGGNVNCAFAALVAERVHQRPSRVKEPSRVRNLVRIDWAWSRIPLDFLPNIPLVIEGDYRSRSDFLSFYIGGEDIASYWLPYEGKWITFMVTAAVNRTGYVKYALPEARTPTELTRHLVGKETPLPKRLGGSRGVSSLPIVGGDPNDIDCHVGTLIQL